MRRRIAALPARLEFAVVLSAAFGVFILASLLAILRGPGPEPHHNTGTLLALAIYETVVLAALSLFLWARGWTLKKIGLHPTLKDTGFGALLFIAYYAVWVVTWIATVLVSPQTAQTLAATKVVAAGLSPIVAVAVSLINPVFEEVFVTGYVMTALRDEKNAWRAINASVALDRKSVV